jgi:23S rRNA pseudouridine1911/1915/1917 synthase
VRAEDEIAYAVPPPQLILAQPQAIPLSIIYEDPDILVINKPKGMVVHPAAGHAKNTLVNALLHHVKDLAGVGGALRPGIVHRLDKDTSGVMVIAKNDLAQASLTQQFKNRAVKKIYWALVYGVPRFHSGRIETLFGRHPVNRKKMAVIESSKFNVKGSTLGKREGNIEHRTLNLEHSLHIEHCTLNNKHRIAITTYKVIKTFRNYSLLEVNIETGRTHQIRVHLNHIGCPVVGDPVYGKRKNDLNATTQMLHAEKIEFLHPRTGKTMMFEAPLPRKFAEVLKVAE